MFTSFLLFLHFLKRESRIIFTCLALVKSKPPEAVTQCRNETPAITASKRPVSYLSPGVWCTSVGVGIPWRVYWLTEEWRYNAEMGWVIPHFPVV